jgi:hypothetical protein
MLIHTIKCIESTLIIKYTLKASFSLSKNILKFKKNHPKVYPLPVFRNVYWLSEISKNNTIGLRRL